MSSVQTLSLKTCFCGYTYRGDTKQFKALCSLQLNQPVVDCFAHHNCILDLPLSIISVPSHQLREVSTERYTSCTLSPHDLLSLHQPCTHAVSYGMKKGLHLVSHCLLVPLPPGMEIMKSFPPFNSHFQQQGPNHLPSHHPERFTVSMAPKLQLTI